MPVDPSKERGLLNGLLGATAVLLGLEHRAKTARASTSRAAAALESVRRLPPFPRPSGESCRSCSSITNKWVGPLYACTGPSRLDLHRLIGDKASAA